LFVRAACCLPAATADPSGKGSVVVDVVKRHKYLGDLAQLGVLAMYVAQSCENVEVR